MYHHRPQQQQQQQQQQYYSRHEGNGGDPKEQSMADNVDRMNDLRGLSPPLRNKYASPPPARSNSTPPGRNFNNNGASGTDEGDYLGNATLQTEMMMKKFGNFGLNAEVRLESEVCNRYSRFSSFGSFLGRVRKDATGAIPTAATTTTTTTGTSYATTAKFWICQSLSWWWRWWWWK
jgi:hypothetical protein